MTRIIPLKRIKDNGIDLTDFDKFPREPRRIDWGFVLDIAFLVSFLCLTLWVLYRVIWR